MARVTLSGSLLNTEEAARFLRVSEASIRRWSDSGLLPASRVGRRRERRFAQADLVRFLGDSQTGPRSAVADASSAGVTVGGVTVPLGTHVAPIYSTDAGALRLAVPFLAEGLKARQPCFLIATGGLLERYARALRDEHAIDLDAAVRSGLLTTPDIALNSVSDWERLFGQALAGGPSIIRAAGEMACIRKSYSSDGAMMAFEEGYEVMGKRYPHVSLCQYDAREFDGEIVLRALKAHPDMFGRLGGFLN
jgi:transcriptional repressor of dcmA and dcmR